MWYVGKAVNVATSGRINPPPTINRHQAHAQAKPKPTTNARTAKAYNSHGFKKRLNTDLADLRRFTRIFSCVHYKSTKHGFTRIFPQAKPTKPKKPV
ncbi:MAG: hypothetical protein FWG87_00095 [Defluviitaleaceae bacterium]|nr:hypothetical protein [Defluviitaleaceae bacterium]